MPVGGIANISIAQAFDVTIRPKQRDFKHYVIGCNTFESAYDIRVQNGGMLNEVLEVVGNLSGGWIITD